MLKSVLQHRLQNQSWRRDLPQLFWNFSKVHPNPVSKTHLLNLGIHPRMLGLYLQRHKLFSISSDIAEILSHVA